MKKREHYIIALLMTTLIFIVGIILGSEITRQRTESLQAQLQLDILQTRSLELELAVFERVDASSTCNYLETRLKDVAKKKVEFSRLFDTEKLPEGDAKLLESQYVESLVRFYLLTRLQEEKCDEHKPSVLFFFDSSEASREQGRVLDNIVYSLSDENITVFAFNNRFQESEPLISLMYKLNNVTALPTIVVNNQTFEGFQSKHDLTEIICQDYNVTIC